MSYKPKHCNECGDKIERANWGITASRHFCDVCATDFRHVDWLPKISLFCALLLMIFAIGLFFRKPEKTLVVSSNQPANIAQNQNRNAVSPTDAATAQNANSTVSQPANANVTMQPRPAAAFAAKTNEKIQPPEIKQSAAAANEAVYFCGAQTRKGTPCTRRVKGGGRCWQHAGQAAMLAPQKLIAN